MHCHIELHNLDGMAMSIVEAPDRIPEPPEGFPSCGSFLYEQGTENKPVKPQAHHVESGNNISNCRQNSRSWSKVKIKVNQSYC